ncbi:hypothetical protein IHE49_05985 [Rhodanobacter sp. 7MK24]|uniref:hypothetical protein n=1 Tax=Rhodanobacter sp. 7MK24 TaxID=2775922 RepID=UPI001782AC0A|nr:hypothetical protein [Rhodanobacter sp. 7MK24]MBD8880025.1 hypothetical protein [Rhodanobacter sp. 7MK24]
MHRYAQPLALCCAIALLCGCHRHHGTATATGTAAPAKAQSSKPAPAPAASAAKPLAANDNGLRVATLTLGTAIDAGYAVTAPATRFGTDTHTIYASVATTGRAASAKLEARWRYLEGQGVLVNELGQTISADGPAVTTFEVQNPNRWPAGKYVVEISLNGKPAAQRDFEMVDGALEKN